MSLLYRILQEIHRFSDKPEFHSREWTCVDDADYSIRQPYPISISSLVEINDDEKLNYISDFAYRCLKYHNYYRNYPSHKDGFSIAIKLVDQVTDEAESLVSLLDKQGNWTCQIQEGILQVEYSITE